MKNFGRKIIDIRQYLLQLFINVMGSIYRTTVEGTAAARPGRLAAPNVTAHPSTAIVPFTVLLYNGPLLCGFNQIKIKSNLIVSVGLDCIARLQSSDN